MKAVAILMVVLMALMVWTPSAIAAHGQGGVPGFLVGCCFGIRSAGAFNEGKDLHWREWILIIPLANFYGMIVNGIDGMNGMTTSDLANQYGSNYY